MTRRNQLRGLLWCLLPAVALAGIAFFFYQERIGAANLERLERGMTKGEVEEILGPPTHGYHKVEAKFWDTGETANEGGIWQRPGYRLDVYFKRGRLIRSDGSETSDNFLGRLRRWLGP